MPSTIGAAMRRIGAEPVPLLHRIGNSPAMMAITAIVFGRTHAAPARFFCKASHTHRDNRRRRAYKVRQHAASAK